ncbi:hypothetical protein QA600_18625 [Natronococcus sp. A-GB1]|uniref:glycine-rich domain-containing protein n=1 Tax=Natronococcus sp. A-GB1 TaxID=3037648 RepID=UPI00241DA34D|nr:hypothetical protein [Natronococcus sp. A-GB1]MDG5761349.1 hypothetical protein [Natronococcus sp. A-GB1]
MRNKSVRTLLLLTALLLFFPAAAAEEQEEFSYDPDNEPQTWDVPDGVEEATFTVEGPGGGGGDEDENPGSGGAGGMIEATIDVSGYGHLDLYVAEGGQGDDYGTNAEQAEGGWGRVDGEDAPSADEDGDDYIGGGGGGMSAVVDPSSDDDLLVAGGGGGGGARIDFFDTDYEGGDGGDGIVGGEGGYGANDDGDDGDAEARTDTESIDTTGTGADGGDPSDDGDHGHITVEWEEPDGPIVSIHSPEYTTYSTSTIPLEVTADDSIDTWQYSLNDASNVTFSPNTTLDDLEEGSHHLAVYATSTTGDTTKATVSFETDFSCDIPDSGDWVVTKDCTIEEETAAPENVYVEDESVVTILADAVLGIDFQNHYLNIGWQSGVLIKPGGTLTHMISSIVVSHLTDEVMHYWPIDEGSGDTVGDDGNHDLDGTIGDGSWITEPEFVTDVGLQFTDETDGVDVGDDDSLNFDDDFSYYVEFIGETIGSHQTLMAKGVSLSSGTAGQYALAITDSGNLWAEVETDTGRDYTFVDLAEDGNDGGLNRIVVTHDFTSDEQHLTLNGDYLGSSSMDGTQPEHVSDPLAFGYDAWRTDFPFTGEIGEVAFWDHIIDTTRAEDLTTVDYTLIDTFAAGTFNEDAWDDTELNDWTTVSDSDADRGYAAHVTTSEAFLLADAPGEDFVEDGRFLVWRWQGDDWPILDFNHGNNYDTSYTVDYRATDDQLEIWEYVDDRWDPWERLSTTSIDSSYDPNNYYEFVALWADGHIYFWMYDPETGNEMASTSAEDTGQSEDIGWDFEHSSTDTRIDSIRFMDEHPYTGDHYTDFQ